jgi:hypothetical protein
MSLMVTTELLGLGRVIPSPRPVAHGGELRPAEQFHLSHRDIIPQFRSRR